MRIQVVEEGNGIRIAVADLSGVARRARDLKPLYEGIERVQRRQQSAWFRTRGRGSWAPLSAVTRATKQARGQPSAPLIATGRLYDSLLGGPGALRRVNNERLLIGTSVPYAMYHQYGTSKMPERKLVASDEQAKARLERLISRYIGGLAAE